MPSRILAFALQRGLRSVQDRRAGKDRVRYNHAWYQKNKHLRNRKKK
jgi:hypothetical protein